MKKIIALFCFVWINLWSVQFVLGEDVNTPPLFKATYEGNIKEISFS